MTKNTTPQKYRAETKKWEKRSWLMEKYWGELLPRQEIADLTDVSEAKIGEMIREHNIPTRPKGYNKHNSISPFAQFYQDKAARTDEKSRQYFDADKQSEEIDPDWEDIAEV